MFSGKSAMRFLTGPDKLSFPGAFMRCSKVETFPAVCSGRHPACGREVFHFILSSIL
jgi:hypothetical protein